MVDEKAGCETWFNCTYLRLARRFLARACIPATEIRKKMADDITWLLRSCCKNVSAPIFVKLKERENGSLKRL